MHKWKFTSFENGHPVTHPDLSWSEAVRAVERAMAGHEPFKDEDKRKPRTAEHRIAA